MATDISGIKKMIYRKIAVAFVSDKAIISLQSQWSGL